MTIAAPRGLSRRGFLLALVATCFMGGQKRITFKVLDDAHVRHMALWAG